MQKTKKIISVVLAAIMAMSVALVPTTVSAATTNNSAVAATAPSAVGVKTYNTSLGVGEKIYTGVDNNELKLLFSLASGNYISIANPSIVAFNGKFLEAKKTGTTSITKVENGKQTLRVNVTVKPAPYSVSLSYTSVTIGKGESVKISEKTNSGSYASTFTWSNSSGLSLANKNTNTVTVTGTAVGKHYVYFKTYNGRTAMCEVNVKEAPTKINIVPDENVLTLKVGQAYTLKEKTSTNSYSRSITWLSSNDNIAQLTNMYGGSTKIIAIRKGTCSVSVKTYNNKKDYITIKVV